MEGQREFGISAFELMILWFFNNKAERQFLV